MNTIAALTQMKKESDSAMYEKLSQVDILEKMMYEMVLEKRRNLLISQALRIRKAIEQKSLTTSETSELIREIFLDVRFVLMHEIGLLIESCTEPLVGIIDISNLNDIITLSEVLQCKPSELYVPRGDLLLHTVDEFDLSAFDISCIRGTGCLSEESRNIMISDYYGSFFNEEILKRVNINHELIDRLLEVTFVHHRMISVTLVHLLSKMFNAVEDDSLRYKIFIILMYAKETYYRNNPPAFGFEMSYVFGRNISFSDIEEGQKHLHLDAIVSVAIKRLYEQNCIDEDLVDEINILHPLSEHYCRDDVFVVVR